MSRSYSIIFIAFGWLVCGLSGSRTPCGHDMECVPNALCRNEAWSGSKECHSAEKCCHTSQQFSVGAPLHCGKSNPDGMYSEEVDDDQAQPHEFPWIVALFERHTFFGAGSLVTENCVLTAAHLLKGKTNDSVIVKAGVWDLTDINSRYVEERQVAGIVRHSEFNDSGFIKANNLALIILKSSFHAKGHIGFICLPSPMATFDRKRCLVSGWGKLTQEDNENSVLPKVFSLPVASRKRCQARLRNYEFHSSVICAGWQSDRDSCLGDEGSPLMCPIAGHPNQYELAGIVTSGFDCGQSAPGLFTSVSELTPWIDDVLNDDTSEPLDQFADYNVIT